MKLIILNKNSMDQNAYLYYDEKSSIAAVIDPGVNTPDILKELNDNKLNLSVIILTHGHYDHIFTVNELKEATGAKIICHEKETEVLLDPKINLSLNNNIVVQPDIQVNNKDDISVGDLKLRVISTPGHSPGGICLYDKDHGLCFTGDTLFREAIGRSDLYGGDYEVLVNNIKEKLLTLPPETIIYPGHGPKSSVEHENKYNAFTRD